MPVWVHPVLKISSVTHGPLWFSNNGGVDNINRAGTVWLETIGQTDGWRNDSYLDTSLSVWRPSYAHAGTVYQGSTLWLLGRGGDESGDYSVGFNGWISRWNPTSHQIERVFQITGGPAPWGYGGALDVCDDGSGGLYVVGAFGVLGHWTGGTTAANIYSGLSAHNLGDYVRIGSGPPYSPITLAADTSINGRSGHYTGGRGTGVYNGAPGNVFIHNGSIWLWGPGLWSYQSGFDHSVQCRALWKHTGGDFEDPANYICQHLISSFDLATNPGLLGIDYTGGSAYGERVEQFAGNTFFVVNLANDIGTYDTTAIYGLASGSDSLFQARAAVAGESVGAIATYDGDFYCSGLQSDGIHLYRWNSGSSWTHVGFHAIPGSMFGESIVHMKEVDGRLWIWSVSYFDSPDNYRGIIYWDGSSFTQAPNFVFFSNANNRLWYSPY